MEAGSNEESCHNLSEEILDKLYLLGYDQTFLRQK
jgi:hypothetical protein